VDQLIYKITPSKDAAVQALEAGDLDVVYMLDNTFIPQFQTITDASVDPQPSARRSTPGTDRPLRCHWSDHRGCSGARNSWCAGYPVHGLDCALD
jgi:hypothetical protein